MGRHGCVALTHDRRIRYKVNELKVVVRHGVAMLVILGAAPHAELARDFVSTLPRIEHFLNRPKPPLIAKVYRPSPAESRRRITHGRVEMWYP